MTTNIITPADAATWLQYLGYWLILSGLLFPGVLRLVRLCKTALVVEDRLPSPPRVPSDMSVLDHELRLLEREGW